jgi:hypothetical protein
VSRQLDFTRVPPAAVTAAAVALIVGLAALLGSVGSDAQWLAALGHIIAARHAIPAGVPFAAAPTAHWPNALVLAELVFYGLVQALGDRGLMLAQLVCVAGGLAILAADARRGGADGIGTAAALLCVAAGALPSLAIARVQMFSLLCFPALIALLRAQARGPSRAIWPAVGLLALWSNLHGAALIGLGVLWGYLLLNRASRRPLESVAVAVAGAAAICLTPALLRTPDYYRGVLGNAAAARGIGMWGPLSLRSPLDLALVAAAALLAARMARGRPARWEWAVLAGLALLTIGAARDGVWLLMFAAGPAARTLEPSRSLRALAPIAAAAAAALIAFAVVRGPLTSGASPALVRGAIALAHGSPVLADGSIDEQVALAGGRIWAGDPIDAFSRAVQNQYLDWTAGQPAGAGAVTAIVRVALVSRGSAAATLMARMPGFVVARSDATAVIYERAGRAR